MRIPKETAESSYEVRLKNQVLELKAKLMFLLTHYVALDHGVFTFPDGDTWNCRVREEVAESVQVETLKVALIHAMNCWRIVSCDTCAEIRDLIKRLEKKGAA